MVDGETIELSGDGFCRRIGRRERFGPEGRFNIGLATPDRSAYLEVVRDDVDGLRVSFNMRPDSWEGRFSAEEDPADFDGTRFTFEGTVIKNLFEDQTMTMRVEVDCPVVDDLVM